MVKWTLIFLIIALIAAFFAFGGVAVNIANVAQLLFFVFLGLFMVSLVAGTVRR